MAEKNQNWFSKLGQKIVPPHEEQPAQTTDSPITNERILDELITCFKDSVQRESVGSSLLFNAHYLIILHPDTYDARKDAFPVVVDEAVDAFNASIHTLKGKYPKVAPIARNWFFKFGAGQEFDEETMSPASIRVIGTLTGMLPGNGQLFDSSEKIKATRRINQTNVYEKVDINLSAFSHLDFRGPGAFVVPFKNDPKPTPNVLSRSESGTIVASTSNDLPRPVGAPLATITYHIGEKNQSFTYAMRDRVIVIAREEDDNRAFPNYLLIDSGYVSKTHARLRYDESSRLFQIASFSQNETRVDEAVIARTDPENPTWYDLPAKAQILLNRMVTLHFQSNL